MKKLAAALFVVAMSAVGASAADLPARPYAKAPVAMARIYNWTGFYVGVNAGGAWNESNGTYTFSRGLGIVIILIGLLIALHPVLPQVAAVGSLLLVFMACTTLSFLATTAEAWVPALGDTTHGFPYLSGTGRLIVKDCIMLGAAVTTMADSAGQYLYQLPACTEKITPRKR